MSENLRPLHDLSARDDSAGREPAASATAKVLTGKAAWIPWRRRRRVIYLAISIDSGGGTEIAAKRQAAWLSGHYDVEIVSVFKTGASNVDGVKITYLTEGPWETDRGGTIYSHRETEHRMSRLTDFRLAKYLQELQRDRNVQAIISLSPTFLRPLALFYRGRANIIHQEHRTTERRNEALTDILNFGYICDTIVCLHPKTRDATAELLGSGGPAVVSCPNGIELGQPRQAPEQPTLVFCGRLVRSKQCDVAIRAFATLASRAGDARLLICGEGPDRPSLERLADSLNIRSRVDFLGFVDMATVWPKASLGLLTSEETFPLVILEAMAHGVPYIAVDTSPAIGLMIESGESGVVVSQDDEEAISRALLAVMSDSGKLERLSAGAYERAKKFTFDEAMRGHMEVIARPRKRPLQKRLTIIDRILSREWQTISRLRSAASKAAISASTERMGALGFRVFDHRAYSDSTALPIDMRNAAARAMLEAVRHAGAPYFVLPTDGWTRFSIAVSRSHRDEIVAALRDRHGDAPAYIEPMFGRNRFGPVEHISGYREENHLKPVHGFLFYFRQASPDGAIRYASDFATLAYFVDFRGDESVVLNPVHGQRLLPPQDCAPSRVHDRWLGELPSLRWLVERHPPFWNEAKIDAVFTWVDGGDPGWLAARASCASEPEPLRHDAASNRYRDNGELRFALRSLRIYAPWINHIYLVTAGQRPEWLDDEAAGVTLVDHRDIFRDRAALPSFNSHAIEANIPFIEGLTEHFIYFNDDFFLNRPVAPGAFFDHSGRPRAVASGHLPSTSVGYDEVWLDSRIHTRQSLVSHLGFSFGRTYAHTPYPLRRSVLLEMWEIFESELRRTSAKRFRSSDDFVLLSFGFQEFALATGRAFIRPGDSYYHSLRWDPVEKLGRQLFGSHRAFVCVADDLGGNEALGSDMIEEVTALLKRKFYIPAEFERPTADAPVTADP